MSREFKAHKVFAACGGLLSLEICSRASEKQVLRLRMIFRFAKSHAPLGMTVLLKRRCYENDGVVEMAWLRRVQTGVAKTS